MFALIVYISIAFALAISVLCIAQLARKPENAAAIAASGQSALIYRKPLYRSAAASTLLFALMLLVGFHHLLEHRGNVLGTDLMKLRVLGWLDHLAERHGTAHEGLIVH